VIGERISKLPFVQHVTRDGNQLLVELEDKEKDRPELVKEIVEAGGRIMAVSEEHHSLEEIYLNLIQEEGNNSGK
jgi:hypothetical protein